MFLDIFRESKQLKWKIIIIVSLLSFYWLLNISEALSIM